MSVLQVSNRGAEVKAKALRKTGVVPMALVEKGGNIRLIQGSAKEVQRALMHAHGAGMIDIAVEGDAEHHSAVVKSVDRDIISRTLNHVTFMQVSKDDKIKVDVPIVAVGTSQAVVDGLGVLMHPTDHIKVRGRVSDIPDQIEVDISNLGVHDSITVSELKLPEGLELMSSPDSQLFSVTIPKEPTLEEEAPATDAGAVPTVGDEPTAE